jgi:uncharacterized membrane protein
MKPPVKFKWRGNHHGYYGIFFIVFGLFNWYMGIDNAELTTLIPLWQSFAGIGIFMLIDDIIEHTITRDTPLRLLYEKIFRPILRRIKNGS